MDFLLVLFWEGTNLCQINCQIYQNTIFVDSLWVHDDLRGQGHGSELMKKAEKEARKEGKKKILVIGKHTWWGGGVLFKNSYSS